MIEDVSGYERDITVSFCGDYVMRVRMRGLTSKGRLSSLRERSFINLLIKDMYYRPYFVIPSHCLKTDPHFGPILLAYEYHVWKFLRNHCVRSDYTLIRGHTMLEMWELGDIVNDQWTFINFNLRKTIFEPQTGIETATRWDALTIELPRLRWRAKVEAWLPLRSHLCQWYAELVNKEDSFIQRNTVKLFCWDWICVCNAVIAVVQNSESCFS